MKKILYSFLCLGLMFGMSSCEDELFYQTVPNGPMVLLDNVVVAVFNAADITNATYEADIRVPANNVQSYKLFARVTRGSFVSDLSEVKTITDFSSRMVITAAELANAIDTLKRSNYNPADPATYVLVDGSDDLLPGDRIDFDNQVTGTIGGRSVTLTSADQDADLATNPNQRSGYRFTTFVSCPFTAADMVGTYSVVADPGEWTLPDASITVSVEAGASANQIIIKDMFGHAAFTPSTSDGPFDVIVTVNATTGQATVARQNAFDTANYNLAFGIGTVDGSGFAFSCTGGINLNLTFRVAAGSFGTFAYNLQKN
ncbi:MAG: hypothetical protein NW226_00955 [Microscillaceae bacterium]|nr:hypothetical protein [Microscillaceae bacterium]